jgi:SAM-dependent methyltransferase
MNLTYPEIFAQRGNRYHDAMLRFPNARDAEFRCLFDAAPVPAKARVLDLPAGGGYLARFLPADAELVSLELSEGFGGGVDVHDPQRTWPHAPFDHAVCLAALHHIPDQPSFIRGLLGTLAPGGILHLADVPAGSSLTRFLDGFVGRYNITGHEGMYLPADEGFYASIGHLRRCAELPCPWHFANEAAMLDFCGSLFGLVDCPPAELREALADLVGFEARDGGVRLDWRLLYVDLEAKK